MTTAISNSLGTCIVRRQGFRVNFAMCVCVPGAHFSFWRSNKLFSPDFWPKGVHFWRKSKIKSSCFWRCLLSCQVIFQQTEMRLSSKLCNNSEIHSRFWKWWSLVVCSQISFYVSKTRKDDKKSQTRFFFGKSRWICYLINICSMMSHFNQLQIERKTCVRTTKYERLLEMCVVQHVGNKSVYLSTNKSSSFCDSRKCKTCSHVLNIPFMV